MEGKEINRAIKIVINYLKLGYRKEYNFSLKYSNSKRIEEIRKKMNEKEKKDQTFEIDVKTTKKKGSAQNLNEDKTNNTKESASKEAINSKKKISNSSSKKAKDSNTNLNSLGKI